MHRTSRQRTFADALYRPLGSAGCAQKRRFGPRVAFLVRFFFGRGMRRANVAALLDDVATKSQHDLDALAIVHDRLSDRRLLFQRLTARHGMLMKQARLLWITEAREALGLVATDSR